MHRAEAECLPIYAGTSEEPLAARLVVAKLSLVVGAVLKVDKQFEPTAMEVIHGH
jgi:hypothetical protein